jgi:hypothetical protein
MVLRGLIVATLVLVAGGGVARAEDDQSAPSLLTHPDGPGAGEWRLGLGLSIDIAPSRIVEGGPRRIPTIEADWRVGFDYGLSLLAELRTQIVTNTLYLGPAISFDVGRFGFMLGYLAVPSFGWLGDFGFDTLTWSVSNQPILRAGLHFERVHLTLEIGAEILFGRWASLGGYVVGQTDPVSYVGAHGMITVENTLRNGGLLIYRIGLISREGYAVLWPAFSDETARLFFPRIEVAYAF